MTAYERAPHCREYYVVEKEETIILCKIMHKNQNGTWLGKVKEVVGFSTAMYTLTS